MELVERLHRLEAYFKRHAEGENPSYEPLHVAVKQINGLVGNTTVVSPSRIKEIIAIYNETTKRTKAKGTGWLDFQLHLCSLIRENGMKFSFDGQYISLA